MSWMRSGTLLSQFLRDFLPTLLYMYIVYTSLEQCDKVVIKATVTLMSYSSDHWLDSHRVAHAKSIFSTY